MEPAGCWVYGLGVVFGGAMLLFGTFAAGAWRSQRWHATTRVLAPAALCATLPLAMQLILVLQTPKCAATPELRELGQRWASVEDAALALRNLVTSEMRRWRKNGRCGETAVRLVAAFVAGLSDRR